ncbi:MAG: asparagine synthase C-terminal domain-containing protein [Actinobacteria bacterium]|nr:asparagine synthase C-terminal domain-containing protein [Actinomycetota bacterium]
MSIKNYNQELLNKELFGAKRTTSEPVLSEDAFKRIESNTKVLTTRMQLLDFETYLKDNLLVKVDRASMYNSLEVRVPFLDNEAVENAFALNDHVSVFNTKKVLRSLLKSKFPSTIFKRPKKGFGIPLARWISNDLKELVDEYLQNPRLFEYFEKNRISEIWQSHRDRKRDNAKLIWMIVMFSGWLNEWY